MAKSRQQTNHQAANLDARRILLPSTRPTARQSVTGDRTRLACLATASRDREFFNAFGLALLIHVRRKVRFGGTPKPARETRALQRTPAAVVGDLRNNENLIGPRIFHFGSGRVAAHIDVPATAIKWTENVPRLLRHRFRSRKLTLRI